MSSSSRRRSVSRPVKSRGTLQNVLDGTNVELNLLRICSARMSASQSPDSAPDPLRGRLFPKEALQPPRQKAIGRVAAWKGVGDRLVTVGVVMVQAVA